MKIGVVGTGRLGICFALLLDRAGHEVIGSDIRTNYVAGLNQRRITTNEPGVADMLANCNIKFTTDTREVVVKSDIIYVMVATPSLPDGSYDISAVERVIEDIDECDFDITGKILVIGCTTNPGDCARIQDRLRNHGISVLYNPEFIAQGTILRDLQKADMVLIGGEDQAVMDHYKQVYNDIQTTQPNVHTMSLTAAELVKIGTNCFLTTKISYANMLGEVLIRSGLAEDVDRALAAVGNDSRVGTKYLRYGFGYGGPCLPRDNRAFAHYAEKLGLSFPLGTIVDEFNKNHTKFLVQEAVKSNPRNLPFYLPSITYKPHTDIMEESQQYRFLIDLLDRGYLVYIEPSDLLPKDTVEFIIKNYGNARFISKQDLESNQTEVIEIET